MLPRACNSSAVGAAGGTSDASDKSSSLALGATLALASGLLLALSMSVQRYALAYPTYRVRFCACLPALPRPVAWWLGFAMYFSANCLFALASTLSPLTLNATLFTLLLLWNCVFASVLLREKLDAPRVVGATLILAGAILSVLGTPSDNDEELGVDDIGLLVTSPPGATFLAVQLFTGTCVASVVVWFERSYRLTPEEEKARNVRVNTLSTTILAQTFSTKSRAMSTAYSAKPSLPLDLPLLAERPALRHTTGSMPKMLELDQESARPRSRPAAKSLAATHSPEAKVRASTLSMPSAERDAVPREDDADSSRAGGMGDTVTADRSTSSPDAAAVGPEPPHASFKARLKSVTLNDVVVNESETTATSSADGEATSVASRRLAALMAVIYPMSLGLLEGVTQLTIKGLTSMVFLCLSDGMPSCCYQSGWLWLFVVLFGGVGVLTVLWLKIVYTRFEVSRGLPIEYGTVHCSSIAGGLVFYQEYASMDALHFGLSLMGVAVVLLGVACSALRRLPGFTRAPVTTDE